MPSTSKSLSAELVIPEGCRSLTDSKGDLGGLGLPFGCKYLTTIDLAPLSCVENIGGSLNLRISVLA